MNFIASLIIAGFALAPVQDVPIEIPKGDWPKLARCLVCKDEHGAEKPAGGMRYKGVSYFFCNTKEVAAFKKDPEAFIPPVLPRNAPAFSIVDTTGELWNSDAMKGKVVLLDWWATWCKPCIEMFPKVDKLREKYAARGFEVLSISIDEKPDVLSKFLLKRRFPNPVLHDAKQAWSDWGVRAIPAMHLVKDGKIVAQWSGSTKIESIEKEVVAALGPISP